MLSPFSVALSPLEERLRFIYLIHQLDNALTRHFNKTLQHHGLFSYSQYLLLATTQYLDHGCNADSAAALNQSQAATHRQIKLAIGRGYLKKTPTTSDIRTSVIQTTELGDILLRKAKNAICMDLTQLIPENEQLSVSISILSKLNRCLPLRRFPVDLL